MARDYPGMGGGTGPEMGPGGRGPRLRRVYPREEYRSRPDILEGEPKTLPFTNTTGPETAQGCIAEGDPYPSGTTNFPMKPSSGRHA